MTVWTIQNDYFDHVRHIWDIFGTIRPLKIIFWDYIFENFRLKMIKNTSVGLLWLSKGIYYSEVQQKMLLTVIWKCHIFSKNDPILIIFLVKIRTDYKFFFCAYFQVHRTHFEKVTSKNVFFHFFKNGKKHTHDTKNSSSQTLALWIFSIFGFGFKHSIAIFSAIQNVIWIRFGDCRDFWKLSYFPFLTSFFT